MTRYEYKTVELDLKGLGLFGAKKDMDFEATLNMQGANGWRYVDTVLQTGALGEPIKLKLVFERTMV